MTANSSTATPANAPGADAIATEERPIGLPTLVMLVIASMIGIGCFVSSGFALNSLGNPARVILAWVLCGGWAIAGAIGYGALAKRVPLSGGEYLYLTRLMHPSVGFLAGWISLVAGFTVPITAMAKTAAQYALPGMPGGFESSLWASAIIAVAVSLHAVGVKVGALAQNLIVLVKLCLIAALFVLAAAQWNAPAVWQGHALEGRDTAILPSDAWGYVALLASMSWISLSYTGFNAAVYVAGESRQARRTVPQAMLWATLLVMAIYVVLNAIFVLAADSQAVSQNPSTIAILAASSIGGQAGQQLLRFIVVLAVLSSVFSMLMAGPRVYAQMARDGVMPKFLDFTSGVPRVAIVWQGVLSIAVVWFSTLEQLISYLGMTLSACSALAVASVWRLDRAGQLESAEQAGASTTGASALRLRTGASALRLRTGASALRLRTGASALRLRTGASALRLTRWEHVAAALYIAGTIAMLVGVLADGQKRDQFWAMCITFALGAVIYIIWKLIK